MAYEIDRFLKIELAKGQSAFLWGARKTGKTTLLRRLFPHSAVFDFLQTDLYLDCLKRPSLFRELVLALSADEKQQPILVDEVQKVPAVLDEIHWLMENKGLSFVLCGSSARKLKRGHANMLGGRAWRFELFPFVSAEVADIDLLRIAGPESGAYSVPLSCGAAVGQTISEGVYTRLPETGNP